MSTLRLLSNVILILCEVCHCGNTLKLSFELIFQSLSGRFNFLLTGSLSRPILLQRVCLKASASSHHCSSYWLVQAAVSPLNRTRDNTCITHYDHGNVWFNKPFRLWVAAQYSNFSHNGGVRQASWAVLQLVHLRGFRGLCASPAILHPHAAANRHESWLYRARAA